jgi:hypothetical protein
MTEANDRQRGLWSWLWPTASFVVVVLAAGMLGVLCFRLGKEDDVQAWLPFSAFGLSAALYLWWGSGVRAQKRLQAALEAYAEREMAREKRLLSAPKARPFSPRRREGVPLARHGR